MNDGFFESFLLEVVNAINTHFATSSFLEVKHLRKVMNIPSSSRSKIIFLSRALQMLNDLGYIEYVGRNSPKKYKKTKDIPVDEIRKMIKPR